MEHAITRCLIQDKTIQAKKMYKKNNDELILSCLKEESVNTALNLLKNQDLGEICEVQEEKVLNPKVRVTGIDNILELDDIALEDVGTVGTSKTLRKNATYYIHTRKIKGNCHQSFWKLQVTYTNLLKKIIIEFLWDIKIVRSMTY